MTRWSCRSGSLVIYLSRSIFWIMDVIDGAVIFNCAASSFWDMESLW